MPLTCRQLFFERLVYTTSSLPNSRCHHISDTSECGLVALAITAWKDTEDTVGIHSPTNTKLYEADLMSLAKGMLRISLFALSVVLYATGKASSNLGQVRDTNSDKSHQSVMKGLFSVKCSVAVKKVIV